MKLIASKRLLFGLLIGLVLAATGCSQQPVPAKPTPTAVPGGNSAVSGERIVAEGRVTPAKNAALSFATAGIVTQVPVAVGDRVSAGQVLAQLDSRTLEFQVAQAEANLALAQARLAQVQKGATETAVAAAQANLDAAQAAYDRLANPDASAVAAAQANLKAAQAAYDDLLHPDPRQLAIAQADVDRAKAALDQAQAAYDRIGGASNPDIGRMPQSLQLQQATLDYQRALNVYNAKFQPAQAQLAAAQAQIQQAQDALARLTATDAQLAAARAQIQQARDALARLTPSTEDRAAAQAAVNAAQAARDLAADQLKYAKLTAPFAGTVITLDIDPGEYAAPGVVVVRLADTSTWQIETTDLTELSIARVSEGTPVSMTFDAVPGLELAGRVARIRSYGDTRQGDIVYTAIIQPDRQDARLRWNMTAKVNIEAQ